MAGLSAQMQDLVADAPAFACRNCERSLARQPRYCPYCRSQSVGPVEIPRPANDRTVPLELHTPITPPPAESTALAAAAAAIDPPVAAALTDLGGASIAAAAVRVAPHPPSTAQSDQRRQVLTVYGLCIASLATFGLTGVVGILLAFTRRRQARGTVWESHYDSVLESARGFVALVVTGLLTLWLSIGYLIIAGAIVYFVHRAVKGLPAAVEGRAYV